MAVVRVLQAHKGLDLARAAYVAGHSLGEYSALAAAGALSLSDTALLLRLRGQSMQKAVAVGEGAMAALIGIEFAPAAALCAEASNACGGAVCQAANDNGGGQVVISGVKAAVEKAMELAKAAGTKRALLLPVSAPFHCALMQPAAEAMEKALADVKINAPIVPLIANVLAAPVSDPQAIRQHLVAQVTGTVRWRESIAYMAAHGVSHFYELGAGKVLSGLVKRIADQASGQAIGTPDDVNAFSPIG
jgi:[acyl-carrier-protein] S-malonyltransferase